MKKYYHRWIYISIFVAISILAYFFPLTGKDLFFSTYNVNGLDSVLDISKYGILTGSISILLAKYKIIRILVYGIITTSLLTCMMRVVDKKNDSLMIIALFFLLLLDSKVLASAYVSLTGFMVHMIGTLFLLILLNIFTYDKVSTLKGPIILILGMVGTSIYPTYSFVFFAVTIVHICMIKTEEKKEKKYLLLIIGELLGILSLVFNNQVTYMGFVNNVLYEFVPIITGANFIVLFVLYAVLLFETVKSFLKGLKVQACLSLIGTSAFMFASLFSRSNIVSYVTFGMFICASYTILLTTKKSIVFKRRITLYYVIEYLYIIISCLFGGLTDASTLFIFIIHIMIILEVYSHRLPVGFMRYVWAIASYLFVASNVYLYRNASLKYEEMNRYIRTKLEANEDDFRVPSRYKMDELYDYLPQDIDSLKIYIKYYDIEVSGEISKIDLHFE